VPYSRQPTHRTYFIQHNTQLPLAQIKLQTQLPIYLHLWTAWAKCTQLPTRCTAITK